MAYSTSLLQLDLKLLLHKKHLTWQFKKVGATEELHLLTNNAHQLQNFGLQQHLARIEGTVKGDKKWVPLTLKSIITCNKNNSSSVAMNHN